MSACNIVQRGLKMAFYPLVLVFIVLLSPMLYLMFLMTEPTCESANELFLEGMSAMVTEVQDVWGFE